MDSRSSIETRTSSDRFLKSFYFDPEICVRFKNPDYESNIGSKKKWKNCKTLMAECEKKGEPIVNIKGPISILPRRKTCDITGLMAHYTDPKTGIWYHSVDIYKQIKSLSTFRIQEYLSFRNANVVL